MTDTAVPNAVSLDRDELLELGDLGTLMALAPQILDHFRKTQETKFSQLETQILLLPSIAGYVPRDAVLRLIRNTANGRTSKGIRS